MGGDEHGSLFHLAFMQGLAEGGGVIDELSCTGSFVGPFQEPHDGVRAAARYGPLTKASMVEMMSVVSDRGHPFLENARSILMGEGGLWIQMMRILTPAQFDQKALAPPKKGARNHGAGRSCALHPCHGVSAVTATNGSCIRIRGDIRCREGRHAAGYYAQRSGEWFKHMAGALCRWHHVPTRYFLTEEIPDCRLDQRETGAKSRCCAMSIARITLRPRQERSEPRTVMSANCKAHWVTPDDPMPEDFSFQLIRRSGTAGMVY